jgi:hypothetical protein
VAEAAGLTLEPATDTEIHVADLGDAATPLPEDAAAAGDAAETGEPADELLTEEQQRTLLAGLWEFPYRVAGELLARPLPEPQAAKVRGEVWPLSTQEAEQLGAATWLAMPASWRTSRALASSPLLLLVLQFGLITRGRLLATAALQKEAAADGPRPAPGPDVATGGDGRSSAPDRVLRELPRQGAPRGRVGFEGAGLVPPDTE